MSGIESRVIVCTSSTAEHLMQNQLIRDLEAARIPHHHTWSDPRPNGGSGNLGGKLTGLRALAVGLGQHYERLIVCDAWDMMYVGGAGAGAGAGAVDELVSKIPINSVIIAADRDPWPDGNPLAAGAARQLKPPDADSPWCWCNGGWMAGGVGAVLEWCDWAEASPGYSPVLIDQQFVNWQLMLGRGAGPAGTTIHDTRTELVYCMAKERGELGMDVPHLRPVNTVFGTRPMFLHFNGRWPVDYYLKMIEEAKCQLS